MKTRFLFGCVTAFALAAGDAAAGSALEPATVTSLVSDGATTTIRLNVATGGCTSAADFRLDVTQEPGRQTLRVIRLRQDACELYAPRGTTVTLTTKDVAAGRPIFVENPVFLGRA